MLKIMRAPALWLVLMVLSLSACGFHLRGAASLPFRTLYIETASDPSLAVDIARGIHSGSDTQVVDTPDDADAILQIVSQTSEKRILSLNSAGRVREFQLFYRLTFRVYSKDKEFVAPQQIELKREFSFDDSQILAKENEEALLYRDMRNDAVGQILRRLSAIQTS